MSIPTTLIHIEEEITDKKNEFLERFIDYKENLHNGTTLVFRSKEDPITDSKYFQLKTTVVENKQKYFIYDEVIEINKKPVLLMRIHNDTKAEILEQLIYFEDDKVVEQIRCLSYGQFFSEVKANQEIIRSVADNTTTIIKTPFLQFIENLNQEKNELLQQKPIKKTWWKRLPWKIIGWTVFIAAWAAIPVIGNLLIAPLLVGVVSASVMTWLPFVTAGLITGCVVAGFNRYRTRLKKWFFPNWKAKSEINLENKLAEQSKMLKREMQQELFLTLTAEAKAERLLNAFQEIWNKNKVKSFPTIKAELIEKIVKNIDEQQTKLQEKVKVQASNLSAEANQAIKDNLEMSTFVLTKIKKLKENSPSDTYDLKIFRREITYFNDEIQEIINKNGIIKTNTEKDVEEKSGIITNQKLVA